MSVVTEYGMTRQGLRDLDSPIRRTQGDQETVNVGPTERTASTVGGIVLAGMALWLSGAQCPTAKARHCASFSVLEWTITLC
jgi:hypothetical protein